MNSFKQNVTAFCGALLALVFVTTNVTAQDSFGGQPKSQPEKKQQVSPPPDQQQTQQDAKINNRLVPNKTTTPRHKMRSLHKQKNLKRRILACRAN